MMFTSSNQWVLVGLTSSGIGCARATDSGLYTRVAAFQDWIDMNTNHAINKLSLPDLSVSYTTVSAVSSNSSLARAISHANIVQTSTFTILIFLLCCLLSGCSH